MANLFSSAQTLKGAMKADLAKVRVNGMNAGLLIQNIGFSFSQAVTMLYEVGSADVYYVVGRAQGNAGISRVIGPVALNLAFLQRFGNGCLAPTNQIDIEARGGNCGTNGQANGQTARYRLDGCVITTISGQINAQDMLINEQAQMTFINLDVS